jgi:hypothetical protein
LIQIKVPLNRKLSLRDTARWLIAAQDGGARVGHQRTMGCRLRHDPQAVEIKMVLPAEPELNRVR